MISISLVAGTITGMVVDRIHGRDFMAVDTDASGEIDEHLAGSNDDRPPLTWLWATLAAMARRVRIEPAPESATGI